MTLAFSQKLNDRPTYFVEKILQGLQNVNNINWDVLNPYYSKVLLKTKNEFRLPDQLYIKPKIHTIRKDETNRWKIGNDIHFVINDRTSNRIQFAPIVKCTFTQSIKIHYWYNPVTQQFDKPSVYIGNKELKTSQINALAINDGFNNRAEFFEYFSSDFTGTLIHWTNFLY